MTPEQNAEHRSQLNFANGALVMAAGSVFLSIDWLFGMGVMTLTLLAFGGLFALVGMQWVIWRIFFPELLSQAAAGPPKPAPPSPSRPPDLLRE